MIVVNPFWAIRILLAKELQAHDRTVKAIREAIAEIQHGQHTILEGARSVDDALAGYLDQETENMGEGTARPTSKLLAP